MSNRTGTVSKNLLPTFDTIPKKTWPTSFGTNPQTNTKVVPPPQTQFAQLESKIKNLESKIKNLESKMENPVKSSIDKKQLKPLQKYKTTVAQKYQTPVAQKTKTPVAQKTKTQVSQKYQTPVAQKYQTPVAVQSLQKSQISQPGNSCKKINVDCNKLSIDETKINVNDPITMAIQIMNGLILTLREDEIKTVEPLWKSLFAVCEKILKTCRVVKGTVNISTLPTIPNCIQSFLKESNIININLQNQETLCKFKEQIICLLLVKNIQIKYNKLRNETTLRKLLTESFNLVLNEVKSYLPQSFLTQTTNNLFLNSIKSDNIVNEVVKIITPLLNQMEPLINKIGKVQNQEVNINQNTVETAFNTVLLFVPVGSTPLRIETGGKNTIKRRAKLYRRTKSSKSTKRV